MVSELDCNSRGIRCFMGLRNSAVRPLSLLITRTLAALTIPSSLRKSSFTVANFQNARGAQSFFRITTVPAAIFSRADPRDAFDDSRIARRYSCLHCFANSPSKRLWYSALFVSELLVLTISNWRSLGVDAIRRPEIRWDGVSGYEIPSSSLGQWSVV